MTLLYVDDDREDRELFSEAIANINPSINCLLASNGADAMTKLTQSKPDYIFMDINMPVMDGKECLQQIRNDPSLAHIPVIMYSTSSNERDISECSALGANDFIVKPSSFRALCDELTAIFKRAL
jgi:CheY-like chemotaxis protein